MSELYIGLMSGTSLDAIDAALVECDGDHVRQLHSVSCALSSNLQEQLLTLTLPGDNEIEKLADVEPLFAQESAKAVFTLLEKAKASPGQVSAIGSHGQTIRHRPEKGFTMQIGDPSLIAELTNITVVADFRRRDVAAGGQGAPLVPAFHQAVFSSPSENRVIANVGGIANISILANQQRVRGFDTGPGNVLMDYWCLTHQGKPYDKNGAWAASAHYDQELLEQFMADAFFQQQPPKSTGRERFNPGWLASILGNHSPLNPAVVQATLCRMTAKGIADEIIRHASGIQAVYLCGGGAHNNTLLQHLQEELGGIRVDTTQALDIDPDWVEAVAFAWLAKRALARQPGNLPEVTGAKGLRVLGAIYPAQ